jgi:putative transposase
MSKSLRCLAIALTDIPDEYKITLGYLTYHSGKLFNQALYLVKTKQAKINTYDLYNKLKDSSLHLKNLQSRSAQIVLDEIVRAFKNGFNGNAKFPKFRPKTKPHRTLTYDKTGFKIVGTKVRLSLSKNLRKWLKEKHGIELKYLWLDTGLELDERLIRNIQIVPKAKAKEFELHIIYEKPQNRTKSVNPTLRVGAIVPIKGERVMVLDPNSSNFFAIVIEGVKRPFLIDGKGLKSLLRKYLKKIAELQSRLEGAKKKGFKTHLLEERLSKTWLKVKRLLRHFAHTVSNLILELALKYGVKKIYIGDAVKNKNKESKLNSVADQIWSLLPHGKVKEYLEYKAKEYGISPKKGLISSQSDFIEVEYISEAYTSGVDSSVNGAVSKETYTPEARIKRGLFKTKFLGLLNADVNACRNFLKKLGKFDLISGILKPLRLRIFLKLKGSSSTIPLYGGISPVRANFVLTDFIGRSRGSVNLPVVVRHA